MPDHIVGWESPEVDVLVVDDEDAVRTTMAEILRNEGYEVAEAANGEHALEALRETTVGVILLDLHMPRLDGFEVLQRLSHRDPPVIVLSAAEPDLRPEDGGVMIHAVVRKPADPEDVLGAVAEVLGR
ncbi:MAG TPA: response regulator [Acidimicrobiales bacterium]|nr:response regulator [Acidimicrobiales bacterium]